MEAKRPRMETVPEAHITRTPPTAGSIVLPVSHAIQDGLRATVDVKKVGPISLRPPLWVLYLNQFIKQKYLSLR